MTLWKRAQTLKTKTKTTETTNRRRLRLGETGEEEGREAEGDIKFDAVAPTQPTAIGEPPEENNTKLDHKAYTEAAISSYAPQSTDPQLCVRQPSSPEL